MKSRATPGTAVPVLSDEMLEEMIKTANKMADVEWNRALVAVTMKLIKRDNGKAQTD